MSWFLRTLMAVFVVISLATAAAARADGTARRASASRDWGEDGTGEKPNPEQIAVCQSGCEERIARCADQCERAAGARHAKPCAAGCNKAANACKSRCKTFE